MEIPVGWQGLRNAGAGGSKDDPQWWQDLVPHIRNGDSPEGAALGMLDRPRGRNRHGHTSLDTWLDPGWAGKGPCACGRGKPGSGDCVLPSPGLAWLCPASSTTESWHTWYTWGCTCGRGVACVWRCTHVGAHVHGCAWIYVCMPAAVYMVGGSWTYAGVCKFRCGGACTWGCMHMGVHG